MNRINPRDLILWIVMSYIVLTILNLVISKVFPQIPVLKTGFAIILIFVAVYIVLLFSVLYDRRIDKIELWTLAIVAVSFIISFFIIKNYAPSLFSIFPDATKEVINSIIP